MKRTRWIAVALIGCTTALGQETLPPLTGESARQTFEAMWAGFDPRAEPLEVETLKEWEEDDVVLRVVRFRIGVFMGQKALLDAVYGYPKGGSKHSGLVQTHGGGQCGESKVHCRPQFALSSVCSDYTSFLGNRNLSG